MQIDKDLLFSIHAELNDIGRYIWYLNFNIFNIIKKNSLQIRLKKFHLGELKRN